MGLVAKSLRLLAEARQTPDRAEQIQLIFSLPYDADWRRK
jgi:hypothetical protein